VKTLTGSIPVLRVLVEYEFFDGFLFCERNKGLAPKRKGVIAVGKTEKKWIGLFSFGR
jgi:hypothetical protein